MIRRPPRSTLFPYTTLSDLSSGTTTSPPATARCCRPTSCSASTRSEEHTSELQSRRDLVCRLLLEKKKNQVSYLESKTYLADTLLRDTDAMSMIFSLETRVPFLDHPLVEFVATMPPEHKLHGTTSKYILKKALEDLLPADTLYAPKMGFGLPMAYWMREPPLRGIIDDCLSPGSVAKRGLLSVPGVEHAYKTFYDSTRTDPPSYQLYE